MALAAARSAIALCALAAAECFAGSLAKPDIEKFFPPPLLVGEQNAALPVWPIFLKHDSRLELRGYVFESVDFEPVRGYSGRPINHLVAIDPRGKFLDVRVLAHKEPLFVGERGNAQLAEFAAQYRDLTVDHTIHVHGPHAPASRGESWAILQGIVLGTVTAKAMDRSIVESAISVARANLDAGGAAPARRGAQLQVERHTPMDWSELAAQGMIQSTRFTLGRIEQAFSADAPGDKDQLAAEFQVALLSIPQIGRNLTDDAGWRLLRANLRSASHAMLIAERGPLSKVRDESRRARDRAPFVLRQAGQVLSLRPMSHDLSLALPGSAEEWRTHVLLIEGTFDPAQPFELAFRLTRKGKPYQRDAQADFPLEYRIPDAKRWIAASYEPAWLDTWRQRSAEIAVLCIGLVVLVMALAGQLWLTASASRVRAFRLAYLLFTLGFIGWYAQGQLTIVNVTSSLESLASGGDLWFLFSDPVTVILWAFVLVTLLVWGRGTFCGWLCPFGALQELVSIVTQRLGLKPKRLRSEVDARLKWIKYAALAGIVAAVLAGSPIAESAIEVEPFKTAISLYFMREWPYVAWALVCVAASVAVYRGYCRYLCPLGAALAVTDKLRRWAWIPRRRECGTPCQTCRHRCAYQSIAPAGNVQYSECFQCLDCVAIYQDDERCLPLVQAASQTRRIIPIHGSATQ